MVGKNLKAESYRVRAVELRAIAELMLSTENKDRLLQIAEGYVAMADRIGRFGLAPNP